MLPICKKCCTSDFWTLTETIPWPWEHQQKESALETLDNCFLEWNIRRNLQSGNSLSAHLLWKPLLSLYSIWVSYRKHINEQKMLISNWKLLSTPNFAIKHHQTEWVCFLAQAEGTRSLYFANNIFPSLSSKQHFYISNIRWFLSLEWSTKDSQG